MYTMYPVSSCFLFFVFNPEKPKKKNHAPENLQFRRILFFRGDHPQAGGLHINYQRPPIFARSVDHNSIGLIFATPFVYFEREIKFAHKIKDVLTNQLRMKKMYTGPKER